MAVLVIGVLAVSTAAVLIRLAMDSAQAEGVSFSLVLAALRLGLAAVALVPLWGRMAKSPVSRRSLGLALAAAACLAFHFATWTTSLSYTSIAASTTLVTTNPLWIALFSRLWLGEKLTRSTLLGGSIALLGSLGIGWGSTHSLASHPVLGNTLALIGAWCVSGYFLLGREAQRAGMGIKVYVTIAYTGAALLLIPLPLLWGATYTGFPPLVYLYIGLLALIPQLIGHTSLNWATRWLSPTLVSLAVLFEPVAASWLAYLWFGENPGGSVIGGGALVLTGVAIAVCGGHYFPDRSTPSDL